MKDRSGIEVIDLSDLIVGESVPEDNRRVVMEKAVGRATWAKPVSTGGLAKIKFWIILELGKRTPADYRVSLSVGAMTNSRYIISGVTDDQEIKDVELEENGRALPERYTDFEEASNVCADLCMMLKVHEE